MARNTKPQAPAQAPAVQASPAPVAPLPTPAATSAFAALATMLAANPIQVSAPAPAPLPTSAHAPRVVAVRGGLAIAAVVVTGKPYRVTAPHNVAQWALVVQAPPTSPSRSPYPLMNQSRNVWLCTLTFAAR
jgi:hypothetical protein